VIHIGEDFSLGGVTFSHTVISVIATIVPRSHENSSGHLKITCADQFDFISSRV
jgi:hypothetical protein